MAMFSKPHCGCWMTMMVGISACHWVAACSFAFLKLTLQMPRPKLEKAGCIAVFWLQPGEDQISFASKRSFCLIRLRAMNLVFFTQIVLVEAAERLWPMYIGTRRFVQLIFLLLQTKR